MAEAKLGRREEKIREGQAKYKGGHTALGNEVNGTLFLTTKRIRFDYTYSSGFMKKSTRTLFNVHLEDIITYRVEKSSIFGGQDLVIEFEGRRGIESPVFKIQDAEGWVNAIAQALGE